MKIINKILALLIAYIYIYTIATPAWALQDATSFSPEQIQVQAANSGVPIGTVIVWTKEVIPEGWLECNGQSVNEILYPDLHELMPNTPNYQGYFLRGVGGNSNKLGEHQGYAIDNEIVKGFTIYSFPKDGVLSAQYGQTRHGGGRRYAGGTRNGPHFVETWLELLSNYPYKSNEIRPTNKSVKYIIKAE